MAIIPVRRRAAESLRLAPCWRGRSRSLSRCASLEVNVVSSGGLGCRYLVRTVATPGVDGPDHSAAVAKLWTKFDVSERQR